MCESTQRCVLFFLGPLVEFQKRCSVLFYDLLASVHCAHHCSALMMRCEAAREDRLLWLPLMSLPLLRMRVACCMQQRPSSNLHHFNATVITPHKYCRNSSSSRPLSLIYWSSASCIHHSCVSHRRPQMDFRQACDAQLQRPLWRLQQANYGGCVFAVSVFAFACNLSEFAPLFPSAAFPTLADSLRGTF